MTKITNEPSVIRMFQAMADRIAAGESQESVLDDYGLMRKSDTRLAPPAGFVMVPVEPTPEMRAAYWESVEQFCGEMMDKADARWIAMIAAAPGAAE